MSGSVSRGLQKALKPYKVGLIKKGRLVNESYRRRLFSR